jgi:hypothetical protein
MITESDRLSDTALIGPAWTGATTTSRTITKASSTMDNLTATPCERLSKLNTTTREELRRSPLGIEKRGFKAI